MKWKKQIKDYCLYYKYAILLSYFSRYNCKRQWVDEELKGKYPFKTRNRWKMMLTNKNRTECIWKVMKEFQQRVHGDKIKVSADARRETAQEWSFWSCSRDSSFTLTSFPRWVGLLLIFMDGNRTVFLI